MSSITKQLSSLSRGVKKTSSSSSSSSSSSTPSFTEIRLVLLGKTGSGKSSTANTILGRQVFDSKVGSFSVTQRSRRACGEFRGRHLTLLDTPGVLDTHQTPQDVQRELRRGTSLLYPGPHVFLLVIQIARFTQEEKVALRQIKQALGSHALNYSVVVFTHGDCLEEGTTVQQCLINGCKDLAELVDACGGRYCVFNNRSSKTKEQVSELLTIVNSMMQANGGSYYNSKMLQKAEEDLAQELEEQRRVLYEKEEVLKLKYEAVVKECYDRELEMLDQKSKREMEELRQKLELEKEKEEKLARNWEEAFKQKMEENDKNEKEKKIQEMVRMMEVRREEEDRRAALEEKFEEANKTLAEQIKQEEMKRRVLEEKIQKEREQNERKERERDLQHLQKEQAIRQREEMKRDALQSELNKLTQRLEEQSIKEEDRKNQMEHLLRREREESQRERDIHMETQRAAKRRTEALKQELDDIKMKIEQQKTIEESLKRQLEEKLCREKAKCDREIATLKKQCDKKCSKLCSNAVKKMSAERDSTMSTVSGYVQEMGLVGLNAALESVGTPCCIQ